MHKTIWGEYRDRREKEYRPSPEALQHLKVGRRGISIEGP